MINKNEGGSKVGNSGRGIGFILIFQYVSSGCEACEKQDVVNSQCFVEPYLTHRPRKILEKNPV